MDNRLHIYYEEQVDFERIRQSFIERYVKIMEEMNLEGILVTRIENVQSLTRWRAPFGRHHYVQRYGAIIDRNGKVIFLTRPGDTIKVEAVIMPGKGKLILITSISATLSMLVTIDIICSPDRVGIAAPTFSSTVIEIVPPVNIIATFFLFITISPTFYIKKQIQLFYTLLF